MEVCSSVTSLRARTRIVVLRSDRKLQFYMRLVNYRAGEQQGTSGERERRGVAEIKTKKQKIKQLFFLPLIFLCIINVFTWRVCV